MKEEGTTTTPLTSSSPVQVNFSIQGVLFIVVGSLFLLNNLNVVPWSVWAVIINFWPLLLIVSGLELLSANNRLLRIVFSVISVVLIIGAVGFSISATDARADSRLRQWFPYWNRVSDRYIGDREQQTKEITVEDEQFNSATKRTLSIDFGNGTLNVTDDESQDFARLKSTYIGRQAEPKVESRIDNNELSIEIDHGFDLGFINPATNAKEYKLSFGRSNLSTSLNLTLGSGKAEVNLSQSELQGLITDVGSGSITIDLTKLDTLPASIEITVGSGKAELLLPRNIGVESELNVGSGMVTIDKTKFSDDANYRTPNFTNAARTISLELKVGSGEISVITSR